MAYSETDLSTVETALIDLAAGRRVVKLTIAGKQIEFGQAEIAALKSLRTEIQTELNEAAGTTGYYLTRTSKGL